MARDRHTQLATRRTAVDRIGAGAAPGVGAVDEYLALQGTAVSRLVGCGVEASAAALRMRAEAHRLVRDAGIDPIEARTAIEPIMATVETAIGEVQEELRRVVNLCRPGPGPRAAIFPDRRGGGGPHLRVVRADRD